MLGQRIKQLRQERKLTQTALSELLNISPKAISNYELGIREPDFQSLKLIASFFNVSIDYLLCQTDIRQIIDNSINRNFKDKLIHIEITNIRNSLNDIIDHNCGTKEYLRLKNEIHLSLDKIFLNKNRS